jgi:hypothetical protein
MVIDAGVRFIGPYAKCGPSRLDQYCGQESPAMLFVRSYMGTYRVSSSAVAIGLATAAGVSIDNLPQIDYSWNEFSPDPGEKYSRSTISIRKMIQDERIPLDVRAELLAEIL